MDLKYFEIKRTALILIVIFATMDLLYCSIYYWDLFNYMITHAGVGARVATGRYGLNSTLLNVILCGLPAATLVYAFWREEYLLFRKTLFWWLAVKIFQALIIWKIFSYYPLPDDYPYGVGPITLWQWNVAFSFIVLLIGWGHWKKVYQDVL